MLLSFIMSDVSAGSRNRNPASGNSAYFESHAPLLSTEPGIVVFGRATPNRIQF
jgi:hypothetical protein